MVNKKKVIARVRKQQELAPDIYSMWIETDIAKSASCGQFVMIYPKNAQTLLGRPISICEIEENAIRIVYRIAGKGTTEFSTYQAGDEIHVLGCLGNGFPVEEAEGKHAFLIGGGIGIPPILQLAKELHGEKTVIAGYRDSSLFLKNDFETYAPFFVATEDGSVGTKGNVLNAIEENNLSANIIYACGPMPMLRAIKKYAQEKNIPAYLSLEERMACGVGACLGCVCKTKEKNFHSQVNNTRVCTEGPVFLASEVDI